MFIRYIWTDLCVHRYRTEASVIRSSEIHLRIEFARKGEFWLVSEITLNNGTPSKYTGDPPLDDNGSIENFPESLRYSFTPLYALWRSSMSIFFISIPAIILQPIPSVTDFTRYHSGPRFIYLTCPVTLERGDDRFIFWLPSFWKTSLELMSSLYVVNWLHHDCRVSYIYRYMTISSGRSSICSHFE